MSAVSPSGGLSMPLSINEFPNKTFKNFLFDGNISEASQFLRNDNLDYEDLVHYLVYCLEHHHVSFIPLYEIIFEHENFSSGEDGEATELMSKALVYASYYQLSEVVKEIFGYTSVDAPFVPVNPEEEKAGMGPADYGIKQRFGYEEAFLVAIYRGLVENPSDSEKIVEIILKAYEGFAEDDPDNRSSYLPRKMLADCLQQAQEKGLSSIDALLRNYLKKYPDSSVDMSLGN